MSKRVRICARKEMMVYFKLGRNMRKILFCQWHKLLGKKIMNVWFVYFAEINETCVNSGLPEKLQDGVCSTCLLCGSSENCVPLGKDRAQFTSLARCTITELEINLICTFLLIKTECFPLHFKVCFNLRCNPDKWTFPHETDKPC